MPPKRRQRAQSVQSDESQPLRRSSRIARSSRASSVASEAPEDHPIQSTEDGLSDFTYTRHPNSDAPQAQIQEEQAFPSKKDKGKRKKTSKAALTAPAVQPIQEEDEDEDFVMAAIKEEQEDEEAYQAVQKRPPPFFDVDLAVSQVFSHPDYVHRLTSEQKDAVIHAFVEREDAGRRFVNELETHNEELRQDLEKANKKTETYDELESDNRELTQALKSSNDQVARLKKNSFRNYLFQEELEKKQREERAKVEAEQQTQPAEPSTATNTTSPANAIKKAPAAENEPEPAQAQSKTSGTAITTTSTTPPNQLPATPTPHQQTGSFSLRSSFLGRLVGSISSPFSSHKQQSDANQTESQSTPSAKRQLPSNEASGEPLGQLPAHRKRRAADGESEEPLAKRPTSRNGRITNENRESFGQSRTSQKHGAAPEQPQAPSAHRPTPRKRRAPEEPEVEQAQLQNTPRTPHLPPYKPLQPKVFSPTKVSSSTPQAISNSKTSSSPRHPSTIHSARNRPIDSPMTTISERTEPDNSFAASQQTPYPTIPEEPESDNTFTVPEPTPAAPSTVPRRRTVGQARAEIAARNAALTPARPFQKPAAPREPNADARMLKLHRYRDLNLQLKKLKEDPEIIEMVRRPFKRVKVDTLDHLPHHRPGESSGTFRVPEIFDDEIEVDADDTDYNIFSEANPATSTTAPPTAPVLSAAPVADKATAPTPAPQRLGAAAETGAAEASMEAPMQEGPAMTFDWPDVGQAQPGQESEYDQFQGAKFTYGLASWMATGTSAVTWT